MPGQLHSAGQLKTHLFDRGEGLRQAVFGRRSDRDDGLPVFDEVD